MRVRLFLVACLLGPATALADDTTSYRQLTLPTDAVGIGLLTAGGFAGAHDDHTPTDARKALWVMGSAAMLGTPIIHIARGHTERGIGALLMRASFAGVGGLAGYAANSECDQKADGFCDVQYVGYGILAGLVVASALDAAYMTDEKVERESWAPQAWANPHGAGAGVAVSW
jgi:hypothetical protein